MIKMQFELSQMTVIDESVNASEYDDMEFVEFLEFLVRIAFHQHIGDDRLIEDKLTDFLREVIALTQIPFFVPPKHNEQDLQAS